MRWLRCFIVLVGAFVGLTSAMLIGDRFWRPAIPAAVPADDLPWRRTRDGWEVAWWLCGPKEFRQATVHPALLAFFQTSIAAWLTLVATHRKRPGRSRVINPPVVEKLQIDEHAGRATVAAVVQPDEGR